MSYQVLARKWRPRIFKELVGQQHVIRPLINALREGRIHHAFLFAGTRGVGKTTIARIFAKALNCEQGVSAEPCGVCASCQAIDAGRFVDLIEVDAASRTKVEDTRDLLENVQYAPSRGRYKVYLIDEVHMLSKHSFNALLKTLEEPPPYVKFLLATTDPQRLPITILSRCLQFKLKRLPTDLIAAQLDAILQHENIVCEAGALKAIAQAGDGSMRDALSLLDQAIAYGAGQVLLEDVSDMLGLISQQYCVQILTAIGKKDADAVLSHIAELHQDAPDYLAVLADLLSWLQRIALLQIAPDAVSKNLDDIDTLQRLAELLSPEDVQLYYQIALIGRRDLPLVPEARSGFEMILLRMLCFSPAGEDYAQIENQSREQKETAKRSAPPALEQSGTKPPAAAQAANTGKKINQSAADDGILDWNALLARLGLGGIAQQLALHCALETFDGTTLSLLLDPANAKVRTANTEQRLNAALENHFGKKIKLQIKLSQAEEATPARLQAEQSEARRLAAIEAIQQDPHVQAMQSTFNAQLDIDSIQPVD